MSPSPVLDQTDGTGSVRHSKLRTPEMYDSGKKSADSSYRPDIDGLRAVAVLLVVFCHYGASTLSGGFVGVDVFFVISGFLITGGIRSEIAAGHFKLRTFYGRRIRRIFPALAAVLVATLIGGWFLLLPQDFAALGDQAFYSALGLSNFYFLAQVNYFSRLADLQPLLHTWSLGVEEQFYLAWPLIVLLAYWAKMGTRGFALVALSVVVVSVVCAIWLVFRGQTTVAFYSPYVRAWELGIGALVTTLPAIRSRVFSFLAVLVGLGLILGSALTLDDGSLFPGLAAVPSCVGAALIVWPKAMTALDVVLSNRAATFVGKISYSLYLWHWPVLVMFRHRNYEAPPDLGQAIILVFISLALACLSWRFVELPFRRRGAGWRLTIPPVGAALAVALMGWHVSAQQGVPQRLPESVLAVAADAGDVSPARQACHRPIALGSEPIGGSCVFGRPDTAPKYLVWADSHGVELSYALGERLAPVGEAVMSVTYSSCPPAFGFEPQGSEGCAAHNEAVLNYVRRTPGIETLVLAAYFGWAAEQVDQRFDVGFGEVVAALRAAGKRVVIVEPAPEFAGSVPHIASRMALYEPERPMMITLDEYRARNGPVLSLLAGIANETGSVLVPTSAILCGADGCPALDNGHALLFDSHHLSMHGARLLAAAIPL